MQHARRKRCASTAPTPAHSVGYATVLFILILQIRVVLVIDFRIGNLLLSQQPFCWPAFLLIQKHFRSSIHTRTQLTLHGSRAQWKSRHKLWATCKVSQQGLGLSYHFSDCWNHMWYDFSTATASAHLTEAAHYGLWYQTYFTSLVAIRASTYNTAGFLCLPNKFSLFVKGKHWMDSSQNPSRIQLYILNLPNNEKYNVLPHFGAWGIADTVFITHSHLVVQREVYSFRPVIPPTESYSTGDKIKYYSIDAQLWCTWMSNNEHDQVR